MSSSLKYKEHKIATTTRIVQTKNVTLPQITACFANYSDQQFFMEEDIATVKPVFNQSSLIGKFMLGL